MRFAEEEGGRLTDVPLRSSRRQGGGGDPCYGLDMKTMDWYRLTDRLLRSSRKSVCVCGGVGGGSVLQIRHVDPWLYRLTDGPLRSLRKEIWGGGGVSWYGSDMQTLTGVDPQMDL